MSHILCFAQSKTVLEMDNYKSTEFSLVAISLGLLVYFRKLMYAFNILIKKKKWNKSDTMGAIRPPLQDIFFLDIYFLWLGLFDAYSWQKNNLKWFFVGGHFELAAIFN